MQLLDALRASGARANEFAPVAEWVEAEGRLMAAGATIRVAVAGFYGPTPLTVWALFRHGEQWSREQGDLPIWALDHLALPGTWRPLPAKTGNDTHTLLPW